MTGHIAHLDVARLRHGRGDPPSAGFVKASDRVNRSAERAPGFPRRARAGAPEAALGGGAAPFGGGANAAGLSVRAGAEAVRRLICETLHGAFFRRRAEWVAEIDGPTYAPWPVGEGRRPVPDEAAARRGRPRAEGPRAAAHDFPYLDRAARATELSS